MISILTQSKVTAAYKNIADVEVDRTNISKGYLALDKGPLTSHLKSN